MIANDKVILLADAESGEDIVEDLLGGDFAGDFADVAENFVELLAQQVARTPICQCLAGKR